MRIHKNSIIAFALALSLALPGTSNARPFCGFLFGASGQQSTKLEKENGTKGSVKEKLLRSLILPVDSDLANLEKNTFWMRLREAPNKLINGAFGFISEKVTGKRYRLGWASSIAAASLISIYLTVPAYKWGVEKLANQRLSYELTQQLPEIKRVAYRDYRYSELRLIFEDGSISDLSEKKEKTKLSYLVLKGVFDSYYESIGQFNSDSDEALRAALSHPIFAHIKNLKKTGVTPTVGFVIPKDRLGPLSDSTAKNLVTLTNKKYLGLEVIADAFSNSEHRLAPELITDPNRRQAWDLIVSDTYPFRKYLISKYQEGSLSSSQLEFRLGEDLSWEIQFEEWNAIGATRLQFTDGHFINDPQTLDIIRNETRKELHFPEPDGYTQPGTEKGSSSNH